jgi:NHLM bacteriocin system ABC transporter peptidase/ATP-binding protein
MTRELLSWLPRRTARSPRVARTPTMLQMDALECGAVSLSIILAHHGHWVAVGDVAERCGVSRDGSSAVNLLRAARTFGLGAQGFRAEPAGLRKLDPPFILHWKFSHFLVFDGFLGGGRVRVNDPATGPRVISEQELDESMTGVVLTFEPTPSFQRAGRRPRPLESLRARAAGMRAGLALLVCVGLALMAIDLAAPTFSRVFVDSVLLGGRADRLGPLLLAMAVVVVLVGALTWVQSNELLRLENRAAVDASRRFLWHVLRLPIQFFDMRNTGAISERVPLNDRVAQFVYRDLVVNALGVALVAFFVALMARYSVVLTLTSIGVVSLNVAALHWVARRRMDGNLRLREEESKLTAIGLLGLRLIETVKATGSETDLFAKLAGYQARVVNTRQDLNRSTYLLASLPPLLAAVNAALILGLGGIEVMRGRLSLGALVGFQVLMTAFLAPTNRLVSLAGRLQTAESDVRRLDDVLRHPPSLGEEEGRGDHSAPGGKAPAPLSGSLELRAVTFGFNRLEPPLIEEFSLTLRPGSRVALVGKTGSGKSTVSRLVSGLYEPWSGGIVLDGRPRREVPHAVRVRSVSVVDQEIFLFEGTVRENLTLWDPEVPLERVVAAAKDACIHEEIIARPGGYDGRIEERGANWSGGQRQRLEIARALVHDPALLVLDEATSALDPITEARIDRNLRRRACTCLMVAHRLSTIRDADEIIVLERGRVVQRGSHDELIRSRGEYAHLIASE